MTTAAPVSLLRIMLVDDHRLLAHSLALALSAEGVDAHVAELDDRESLLALARAELPDLVVLDLQLGGRLGDGAALVGPLTATGCRVLIVSGSTDAEQLGRAVEAGAVGLLSKSDPFERLLTAVVDAARGLEVMPEAERHRILANLRQVREQRCRRLAPFDRLTEREQQVLRSLCEGKAVGAIAAEWYVAEATVRTQVRGVLMKLGVGSQLEAVALAVRSGWLTT